MSNKKSASDFYLERDKRTSQYLGQSNPFDREVFISIDPDLYEAKSGHVLITSLANMLSRVHRNVFFKMPKNGNIQILIPSLFQNHCLREETIQIMREADPYGSFEVKDLPGENAIVIGLGREHDIECDYYVGANGALATISKKPVDFNTAYESTLIGAATAACLSASTIFKMTIGKPNTEISISLWDCTEGAEAGPGPVFLPELKFLNALIIGGGAVGSNFGYWSRLFGDDSKWTLVEKDIVKLHNLNRSLLFFAYQTNWNKRRPERKGVVTSKFMNNSNHSNMWFHEFDFNPKEKYDVVLCLANEHNVRKMVNFINCDFILQGATDSNWTSQLHRHIKNKDDCVFCRTGKIAAPQFGCSTVKTDVGDQDKSADAALPFLSAMSGLLLIVALMKESEGVLRNESHNDKRIDFLSTGKVLGKGIRACKPECDVKYFYESQENTVKSDVDQIDRA